jgi:hypothetical protein
MSSGCYHHEVRDAVNFWTVDLPMAKPVLSKETGVTKVLQKCYKSVTNELLYIVDTWERSALARSKATLTATSISNYSVTEV